MIAASYWGKFKTVSQMFMLILLIADLGGAFNMIAQVLIWVSLVLTIVSLIDYIAKECTGTDTGRYVGSEEICKKADKDSFERKQVERDMRRFFFGNGISPEKNLLQIVPKKEKIP